MYYLHFTEVEHYGTESRSVNQWEGEDSFDNFKDAQLAMVRESQRFYRGLLGTAKNIHYLWENDHARRREIVYNLPGQRKSYRVTVRRDVDLQLIMGYDKSAPDSVLQTNNESPVKESFSDMPRD